MVFEQPNLADHASHRVIQSLLAFPAPAKLWTNFKPSWKTRGLVFFGHRKHHFCGQDGENRTKTSYENLPGRAMTLLVLASKSPTRLAILENAGLQVRPISTPVDERALEAVWQPDTAESLTESISVPAQLALHLASAKAHACPAPENALVIAADQITSLQEQPLHKPSSLKEAKTRLRQLSGKTHRLDTAFVLSQNGTILFSHVEPASLTLRTLTEVEIDAYCTKVGDQVLESAGCYRVEGEAIALFDRIEGDHYAILGLPILTLLSALRSIAPQFLPEHAHAR
jgi:septum formation protein